MFYVFFGAPSARDKFNNTNYTKKKVFFVFCLFFPRRDQYLQIHLRTPQSGEPGPPMDWFYLENQLFIIFQLHEVRPTHLIFGMSTLVKFSKITPLKTQKRDPQTRGLRVRGSSGAQNVHKSDSLGVLVQPEERSGSDF